MSPPPNAEPSEADLARDLASLPETARTRVVLGALGLAIDSAGRRRGLSSDAVAAMAATVVAVVSLVLTLDQSRTQRLQLGAAVWPSLRIGHSNFENREHPEDLFFVANGGVGPARIQAFTVTWKGQAFKDSDALFHAACPDVTTNGIFYGTQTGTLLSAGARAIVIGRPRDPANDECVERMFREMDARACYCSVLDECWTASYNESEPARVHDCTQAHREPQFGTGD